MKTVVLAIAVGIVLCGCVESHDADAATEARQKNALLRSLHRGMSRVDFYRAARRIGVTPRNPDYVRFAPNGQSPIDNGDFPMPNAGHPHPMVSVFLDKPHIGCGLPVDVITVYFDSHDNLSKWYSREIRTGDCL
jgi:hypothetical protein